MNALSSVVDGVLIALLYIMIGPLVLVIWLRVALWIGVAFGLDDSLGKFVAETRRSFDNHRRLLSREMGELP